MLVAWDALRVSLFLFCRLSSQDFSDIRVVFSELKVTITAEDCVCLNDRIITLEFSKFNNYLYGLDAIIFFSLFPSPHFDEFV